MKNLEIIRTELENRNARSAWKRGVEAYAFELLDELKAAIEYNGREPATFDELKALLLNGADDWTQYSYGVCALIYDTDIAERLCCPSELKKRRGGQWAPNRYETWLDVQARALRQAARRLMYTYKTVNGFEK